MDDVPHSGMDQGRLPPMTNAATTSLDDRLLFLLRAKWGYESQRPHQAEAMCAVVEGRDSVVALPTGSKPLGFRIGIDAGCDAANRKVA